VVTTSQNIEHVDVLIIGGGISGIGAAYYLQTQQPTKSYAILEARGATGGTWDLFRYPGIRSDSDLHTFGYEFKPWEDEDAIASADKILAYLRETVAENGIDRHVRFHHKVLGAAWSSDDARWRVEVERLDKDTHTRTRSTISANWLFAAGGYYRYDEGFTPNFEGRERFRGQIVHPQHWPQDLDYRGKRVVVIGSGATAVTLVPAMADDAAHVTMLQRSPTYIMPVPQRDAIANALKKVLGADRGYAITRRKNMVQQRTIYRLCQRYPRAARRLIRHINARQLPAGYPVDEHFNPSYNPWDQRLCAVPNADLFKAIKDGKASVVTDRIVTFTERGIALESGDELEADIIITATGLNLQAFGGISLTVDDEPVRLSDTVAYKSMMLSGVPNFAFVFGYTNSSWTLKVGPLCEHFCRLLAHMDAHGYDTCYAEAEPGMETRPLLDLSAGYVQRAVADLPRQGDSGPWQMVMDFRRDVEVLRDGPVTDDSLRFRVSEQQLVAAS
jgi:cation diffusion facilitator CzcD-associated flavoprotein CzcO